MFSALHLGRLEEGHSRSCCSRRHLGQFLRFLRVVRVRGKGFLWRDSREEKKRIRDIKISFSRITKKKKCTVLITCLLR